MKTSHVTNVMLGERTSPISPLDIIISPLDIIISPLDIIISPLDIIIHNPCEAARNRPKRFGMTNCKTFLQSSYIHCL